MEKLRNIFDGVKKKHGVIMKWFGGHGVHGYRHGKELYFWNTGDFSKVDASPRDIRNSMKRMKREGNYADYT